uniref:Uncharacterized protein n=1 Tax=Kalanchoe fedtschenkoi TaxID=63787 RepID=A0A7N0SWV7_KALFE
MTHKYDCLLFDLDDTLYPLSTGLASAVLSNITAYMVEKLGIEESKIPDHCNLLYKNYGTTLAGLRAIGYDFDCDEYHSFVHGRLPYEILKPDPVLRNILSSLPIRKVIFTNADKVHAAKVVNMLGLEDCFEDIVCFESLNPIHKNSLSDVENDKAEIFDIIGHFAKPKADCSTLPKTPVVCKPSEYAIELALKIANINPRRTLFFEDSIRNIQAGKRVGLDTVLLDTNSVLTNHLQVGQSQKVKGADYVIENIHNLREALPELWESDMKTEAAAYSGALSVKASVTA